MWRKYFKLLKIVPGPVIIHGFGTVDFSSDKLPVETCKKLFEADSIYLEITPQGKEHFYGIKPKIHRTPRTKTKSKKRPELQR